VFRANPKVNALLLKKHKNTPEINEHREIPNSLEFFSSYSHVVSPKRSMHCLIQSLPDAMNLFQIHAQEISIRKPTPS